MMEVLQPIKDAVAYTDDRFLTSAPNPQERVEKEGYTAETHEVVTDDGYILHVHRITGSKISPKADNKPVVFLQHGLLDCSVTWVIGTPKKSLGYILADKGYDVWMGNVRGSRYSRKHKWISTKEKQYWLFSWHEIGVFDLPAMIDYALGVTKQQKLLYVGHSQGTTAFFVMASLRPEYQRKIEAMFALAPVAFMSHASLPIIKTLVPIANEIKLVGDLIGLHEFIPTPKLIQKVAKEVCSDTTINVCGDTLTFLISPGEKLLDQNILAEVSEYDPAGASVRQLVHYAQLINSGRFCQYDHGLFENLKRYGSINPPDYPLEQIQIPIYLHYSSNDGFVNVKDLKILYEKLPNREKFLIPEPSFTHVDFVWSESMDTLVYETVLSLMGKHT